MKGLPGRRFGSLVVCAVIVIGMFAVVDVVFNVPGKVGADLPWSFDEINLTNASANCWNKDMAVSGDNIHVVWSDDRCGDYEIYYRKSTDNGLSWNATTKLSAPSNYNTNPRIAVFGDFVHVLWDTGGIVKYMRSSDEGENWDNPISWGGMPFPSMDVMVWPRIMINANNVYIVAIHDNSAQVLFKRSTDNGNTWSNWTVVLGFGWPWPWCSIDVTTGILHVTAGYMGGGSLRWIDHYFSDDDGDTWYENTHNPIVASPTWEELLMHYEVTTKGNKYSLYYAIMDMSGMYHIGTFVEYCYDSDPENWGGPTQVLTNGEGHFDVHDDHIVWGELDGYNYRQLNSNINGQITYFPSNSAEPILKNNGGVSHILWEDDRHGSWELYYTRIGGSTPPYSPSPPSADAGPDHTVLAGEAVLLDGSGSYDPDTHWRLFTVDSSGDSGNHSSIAVDSNGHPHISYHNYIPPGPPPCGDPLKYTMWDGSAWTMEIVDDLGYVGTHTSITLDGSDIPHISYLDDQNWTLKYAKLKGKVWDIETVDSWPTGEHSSIALDADGYPHITYDDDHERAVKYARKNASGWSTEIVCKGTWASLEIDRLGNPHISLIDMGVLKYATWEGISWDIQVVDPVKCEEDGTSLELDENDYPHISYFEETSFNLKYAQWDGDQWLFETIAPTGGNSAESSLFLDSFHDPNICYSEGSVLKYARKVGGIWNTETVDYDIYCPGRAVSLAMDSSDTPQISYYNSVSHDLKYGYKRNDIISYEWDFGDGSPHGFERKATHIYHTPGIYDVTLTAVDIEGNTDTDTCIITVSPSIYLENGWNLVSLPTIQQATDIQTILQSIDGQYDSVQWYDSNDPKDPWKHSYISKPTAMNDLKNLDQTMGFKVHIINPDGAFFGYSGCEPSTNQSISLHSGWNMVGYPSLSAHNQTAALNNLVFGVHVDSMWAFDAATQIWEEIGPSGNFELGKGYWIHATQDCVWEVPL